MSDESHETAGLVSGRRYLAYLLPFFIAPALLVATAFVVIPSHWFALRSGDTYMANLGYGASLKGQDCQVLVYGDSTAMVGVDPKVIEAKTGLTACNIAEFAGVTLVSGTLPVDRFLERNPRPKVMVFLYAPENLSRPHAWTKVGYFEAVTYRVRDERTLATAAVLATHPAETIGWAEQGLRMALTRMRTKPFSDERTQVRAKDLGQLKMTGQPMTECEGDDRVQLPDPAWVAGLRQRYGVGGTKVLVDATPVMTCDSGLEFYRQHVEGLVDDRPIPLYPPQDYLGHQGARLHVNAAGSAKLSAMIADQVVALQGGR